MDDSRLPFCPPAHVQSVLRTREEVKRRLSLLVAANPKFVIGSDAYHTYLYKDIEYMVELGMQRKEALKGITVYAGQLMDRKVGILQEGYQADFIAVPANPLIEKEAVANPTFVMRKGVIVRS